ncbi:MAG: hypothetical protein ACKOEJ_04820 [Acidimicrobiaceae bacterium]
MKFLLRAIVATAIVLIVAMWVYALFFASKVSVNKFDDRIWAVRAQERCLIARQERKGLSDYRVVDSLGKDALFERADLIDLATDTIESFVNEFRQSPPSDPKGRELVGLWLDDYEIYIADRREFSNNLRAGINEQFAETPIEGLPISEKIATFAADNEMSYCKPPIDLSI